MYDKNNVTIPMPVDSSIHRWDRDPFARGSYVYLRKGSSPSDLAAMAAPAHDVCTLLESFLHSSSINVVAVVVVVVVGVLI
jgi:hypothetical protein